jgi:DNA polymerase III subunit alpha
MPADFAHLHLHSQYSLLDGANRLPELCEQIARLGMDSVAVTDHGNMFGAYNFYKEALRHGVKPIIGVEAYIAPGDRREKSSISREAGEGYAYHMTLLAENETGYRNLVKLVSEAYLTGFYNRPRMDRELLREYHEGIIALTGCLKGEVAGALSRDNYDRARQAFLDTEEIFGRGNLFIELMDHGLPAQQKIIPDLLRLSRETGAPVVATNDSHYLKREDAFAHEVLLCIGMGKTLDDEKRMRFYNDEFYVKNPDEMKARFASWTAEAVTNAAAVAARCGVVFKKEGLLLPQFEPPTGHTPAGFLRKIAGEGLEERLGEMAPFFASGAVRNPPEKYRERLAYELAVIEKMGFPSYFLIVWDFIRHAKERGIAVGPGRGSAAGSIVSWALRITEIDPLRYDLLFERFLNPDRISMPDIDIDFCQARRGEVIDYVTRRYGRDHVAQIVTFSQLKPKAAVRDVARVLSLPVALADRISRAIPGAPDVTFEKALKDSPDLRTLVEADEGAAKVVRLAERLENLSRHAGMHAAGIVIAPKPITEFLPLYRTNDDQITTQFDMKAVEEMGLLKIDFLGLITLDIIEDTVRMIAATTRTKVDVERVPLNDDQTFSLFRDGKTGCVFQFDSGGMRDLLRKARPETFSDLAALNALYRPGALDAGTVEEFIRRRNGQARILFPLPELEPILKETYGILVYQEQVMRIAQIVAGYSLAEADLLRKAMGKKLKEVMLAEAEKFIRRAVEHGCPKKKAQDLWSLIEPFARYGFNKSHAVAYALIAYKTAYLKAHYPVHFLAACLTAEIGNTDGIVKILGECADSDINVLPPDINESSRAFAPAGSAIRFGLAAVRGVGEGAAQSVLEEHGRGAFASFTDFVERVDARLVNKKTLEALIAAGAFDSLSRSRASLAAALDNVMARAARRREDRELGQSTLFSAAGSGPPRDDFPDVSEWTLDERLKGEKDALGFYVTGHPLAKFEEEVRRFGDARAAELRDRVDQTVKMAGIVTSFKRQKIKKGMNEGKLLAKFMLEDTTGQVSVVVFSALYEKVQKWLAADLPVLVTGTVRDSGSSVEISATDLVPLDGLREKRAQSVEIRFDLTLTDAAVLARVRDSLRAHPGPTPVSIRLVRPGEFEAHLQAASAFSIALTPELAGELRTLAGEEAIRYVY